MLQLSASRQFVGHARSPQPSPPLPPLPPWATHPVVAQAHEPEQSTAAQEPSSHAMSQGPPVHVTSPHAGSPALVV